MVCATVCLAVVWLVALPNAAWGQTTARDTLPIVRKVRIEGNTAFSDTEIKRAIATRASGCKSVFLAPLCWLRIGAFVRTERFDSRELRTDVARIRVYHFRRGYRQAQVDTSLVREGDFVDVTFLVDEGAPVIVRSLEVSRLEDIPDARAILSRLPLKEGQPFSEVDLTASRERIERELGNRGYPEAAALVEASIPSSDTLGAYVVLEAVPGPRARIGDIEVTGVSELNREDVKRLLTFRPGDLYSEDEIVRSQRNLYSMALFDYVDITREPPGPDSTIAVHVQVSEAKMRGMQFGFGLSTTECLQVQAGWTHRNLFGGTRRFELTGELSNIVTAQLARQFPCSQAGVPLTEDELVRGPFNKVTWRLRADFRQPWFLGTENWLHLGVFSERQSLPGIYARVSYGGDLRVTREISRGTALAGTYRVGRDSLEEGSAGFLFCANFGVCRPDDIETLSEPRSLSWVGVNFARSRTDAVLEPTTGYRLTFEAEHASRFTGSEWAYYRAQGEFSWYRRLGGRAVLALRLRGGLVRPIGTGIEGVGFGARTEPVTHPLKRQYAGGAYTVRGYGQNLLGPKVLLVPDSTDLPTCLPSDVTEKYTWVCDLAGAGLSSGQVVPRPVGGENAVVANLEVRVPLGSERWSGVAFLDLGQVWTENDEADVPEKLAWSPGIGIRYRSPVGPLRLDVGYNTGGSERLPVVSQLRKKGDNGDRLIIVQLGDGDDKPAYLDYDPFEGSGLRGFLNRLQLHFSIGHAF
ncbi:MAG: BamA/TamA family outer membrane protein [Gemmatimonadota bacterium]|nr:MAG: BamA/TamA family outer membrane protein [Gemmatimonadota bacterium]